MNITYCTQRVFRCSNNNNLSNQKYANFAISIVTQQFVYLLPKLPFCYPKHYNRVLAIEQDLQTYRAARKRRQRWRKTEFLENFLKLCMKKPHVASFQTFFAKRSNFNDNIFLVTNWREISKPFFFEKRSLYLKSPFC